MKKAQWYETPEGRARLKVELEAVERFNAPRPAELKMTGKKHKLGHLIFTFAFKPLDGRPDVVRGELMLSSRHPEIAPTARIDEPWFEDCEHLLPGDYARELAKRTIPKEWAGDDFNVPCMWSHEPGSPDAWNPSFTATTCVLNVQSWFLNYLVWLNTGKWPYDSPKSKR